MLTKHLPQCVMIAKKVLEMLKSAKSRKLLKNAKSSEKFDKGPKVQNSFEKSIL